MISQKGILEANKRIRIALENHVKALDLSSLDLTELPPEIGLLEELNILYLYNNKLTHLPVEFARIKSLKTLIMYGNECEKLPREILQLKQLIVLDISYNKLKNLPLGLKGLSSIKELNISHNKLSKLTLEVGELSNLKNLIFVENPIENIPPEIAQQSISNIKEYLKELSDDKREGQEIFEAKILVVGQGGVGKTSLCKRLIFNTHNEDETTTMGIALFKSELDNILPDKNEKYAIDRTSVIPWELKVRTNTKPTIKVNVWDFGGQEIYHAIHQLFFTKRSIYILVWDSRQGEEGALLYYWLHLIENFGEKSPVILVLSEAPRLQGGAS